MKDVLFRGCATAIVTPFNDLGINFKEFERLIEFQIAEKIDALVVCGTTGESSTMTNEEKREVLKFVVDIVKKRIPVIGGTGCNNTKETIELSKYAKDIGCDATILVTPYYNKTSQEGLIAHYNTIASSVNIPIILYNVPSRTSVNIKPETYYKLSKTDNIIAVKEASGNISQIAEIANKCENNLNIYSGNDSDVIPILSLGGIGVISVLSNVLPKKTHDMVDFYLKKDIDKALKIQLKTLNLTSALFSDINPIPIKAALNMIGYNVGIPRLPLIELSTDKKMVLKKELVKCGLKIK